MQTGANHGIECRNSMTVVRQPGVACRYDLFSLCVLLAGFSCQPCLAQTGLYKCTDGSSITYSSSSCDNIGLKSGGEVRDRLTVIPATQPVTKPTQPEPKANTEDEEQRARKAATTVQPINPLIQKLLK